MGLPEEGAVAQEGDARPRRSVASPGVRALAVLSLHTSPLAQPGTGDGGGMNVYVRELSAHLARSGVLVEVFTRADDPSVPVTVTVEPGFRVHHVAAGPVARVPKEQLPQLVPAWTDAVRACLTGPSGVVDAGPVDAIHANYWLSGLAAHALKHELDLPLMSTFHTLDRVKATSSPEEEAAAEPARRAAAEVEIVGCSDAVVASCSAEAEQLASLYGADPSRVEIVAPGVDHAFFAPGDRRQARRAVGLPLDHPIILFVGRIQPLKGLTVAIDALAALSDLPRATLVVVGGPSGPHGRAELAAVARRVDRLGLAGRVRMVPPKRHETLSTYYRAADVCVVPSRSESFGLVALEAAACGVPVVAAAVGGLTTLVDHGRTGYLVDDRDPAAYAGHLRTILTHRDMAAALGSAAQRRAEGYTWAAAASALRDLNDRLTTRELVECR